MAKDKENESSKALAKVSSSEFHIAHDDGAIGEVLSTNLSGEALDINELDRIRIPAGGAAQWSIPALEGDDYQPSFEGVIVGIKPMRAFWASEYTGGGTPPDCYSDDTVMGHGDPLQNGETGWYSCEQCPNSKFGSAERGPGQACKEMRMVMVIRREDLLPIIVALPPTSLKPLKKYMMRLTSRGMKYYHVVTRFKLAKATSQQNISYAVADFEWAAMVDNPEIFQTYRDELTKALTTSLRVTSDDYAREEQPTEHD